MTAPPSSLIASISLMTVRKAQGKNQPDHLYETLGSPPIKQSRRGYASHRCNTKQKQLSSGHEQGKDRDKRERGAPS
jgi:hypothetical protein